MKLNFPDSPWCIFIFFYILFLGCLDELASSVKPPRLFIRELRTLQPSSPVRYWIDLRSVISLRLYWRNCGSVAGRDCEIRAHRRAASVLNSDRQWRHKRAGARRPRDRSARLIDRVVWLWRQLGTAAGTTHDDKAMLRTRALNSPSQILCSVVTGR